MARGGARIGAGRKRKTETPVYVQHGVPAPPPWLSAVARECYAYYAQQLGDRMTPGDRDALAAYATALASLARLEAALQAPGFEVLVDGGVHPLVVEQRQLLGQVKGLATSLGLTPTSRNRAKSAVQGEAKQDWRAVVYQTPTR